MLVTNEKINTKRQFEVDVVKALAILFMVCIHVYEEMSSINYGVLPDTLFRNVMEFLGGPLAAPVFMFAMGMGMVYTRHDSAEDFIKRSARLLLTGYALNFFRSTLLLLIGKIAGIETDYHISILESLMTVDILQFAGMTFLIVGLLKKIGLKTPGILGVALLIQATGIWAKELNLPSSFLSLLLGLLWPTGSQVSFPLRLWLVYPAAGMMFAELLQRVLDKRRFYRIVIALSAVLFVAIVSALAWIEYDMRNMYALADNVYYDQNYFSFLFTLPIVLFALAIAYLFAAGLENMKAGVWIKYLSSNLNTIYIIQWLIITYVMAIRSALGQGRIPNALIVPVGLLIVIGAVGMCALWNRIKTKLAKNGGSRA